MRGFNMVAFVAALVSASPAAAADVATLSCVRDDMTASVRAEIAMSAEALVNGKTATASQELRAVMEATARACAVRHGWSNDAREAAQTHALVSVTLDLLRPVATERNVPLDAFALALKSLTGAQRAQILNQEAAGADALIGALAKQGISAAGSDRGSLIGVMAVIMLVEESQKARFIAS